MEKHGKFLDKLIKHVGLNNRNMKQILCVITFLITANSFAQAPGCPNVHAGDDVVMSCDEDCTDLSATFLQTGETTSYSVTPIPFSPPFPATGGNPVSVNMDDRWSDAIDLPFNFCFYGQNYTQMLVGSNGVVTFDLSSNSPGGLCQWSFTDTLPSPNLFSATIFGPYMDIDPSVQGSGIINWTVFGTAPCRTMVVNYNDIPYYSANCNQYTMTTQIVMYETTNVVEIYLTDRTNQCTTWNNGNAVLGIQNQGGTQATVAPGRNTGNWVASSEAWRFTPNGASNVQFTWLNSLGQSIGTSPNITVCPEEGETTYTARAVYTNCDGNAITVSDTVTVKNTAGDSVDFHLEDVNQVERTEFNLCEDVFLDGSATLNTGSYYLDIWRVNADNSLSWLSAQDPSPGLSSGWRTGSPVNINITERFVNDMNNPVTFEAGVTYEVKLAINDPECGWVSEVRRFTYVEGEMSSNFTIVNYYCHDGVYDVTVTAEDMDPSQWWGLYETSVEGSTSDANTIFPLIETQLGITTATFTNLDPYKFYYIKHGVWTENCPWQETRKPLDRDCCTDNPYIEPYWEFCASENVCELDSWPIRVLDAQGNHVQLSDGVTFSWSSSSGDTSSSDVVYAEPFEEWELTVTYPDGCIYRMTYKQICCEEDIHIEIDECPNDELIANLQSNIKAKNASISNENYEKYLELIDTYNENIDKSQKEDCDPCEIGLVVLRVVDGQGNLVTDFESIVWGDGLATDENIRLGTVNTTYTVTVVQKVNEGMDECVYRDTFMYECPEPCGATTGLRYDCRSNILSWNAIADVSNYIVEVTWDDPRCCRSDGGSGPNYWNVSGTSFQLPYINLSRCFSWRIGTVCPEEGVIWTDYACSDCISFPTEPTPSDVKTEAKISPNPNDGHMNIEISGADKTNFTLNVYRFDGILIKTFDTNRIENNKTILTWNGKSVLAPGMYFFVITTDTETITKKVVIK